MASLGDAGTPVEIPAWLHLVLWPALVVWIAALARRGRTRPWRHPALLAGALVPAALLADWATLMASNAWPTRASNSFVFALLWLAALFTATAFVVLRSPDDRGDEGGDREEPEPPWWPEFERQLRDYMRRRPGIPPRRPRVPAGTRG